MGNTPDSFIGRLAVIVGTDQIAEMQRILMIPYNSLRNYQKGRNPSTESLLDISSKTGASLNWLLCGIGPRLLKDCENSSIVLVEASDPSQPQPSQPVVSTPRISVSELTPQSIRLHINGAEAVISVASNNLHPPVAETNQNQNTIHQKKRPGTIDLS